MAKREYFVEIHRNYKVTHQLLCISKVDFRNKTLVGFTELQFESQVDNLSVIRLNCQQCRIHSIYLNDYMCEFTYSDPTQDIVCAPEQRKLARKLDTFSSIHYDVVKSTDSDFGNGELNIQIPDLSDLRASIREHRPMTLSISFMLECPTGGIYFAVNNQSNQELEEKTTLIEEDFMPHMFTYGRSNTSRLWFPCVDSFSESCTWTIMITVDDIYTAICSGELVEVEHHVASRSKRFTYTLSVPTSAPNIGLVVGPFVPVVHPDMHEVVHFCFPSLKSLLLDTCGYTHRIFEYYEELLNARYPYSSYKQVFIDNMITKYEAYATMSLFSINLLHSKHVIEQTYISRRVLAQAIAEQYFGCFISMQSACDAWLTRGISGFLAYDYYKKAFGNNEYRAYVKRAMQKVIRYEEEFRPIVLDPSGSKDKDTERDYFQVKNFHTFSPIYDKMHRVKSFLIIRMLENYLSRQLLLQVFNKMLSLAQVAAPQKFCFGSWYNLNASTSSFIWAISTVTGKNIDTFLKQWVHQGGHVKLTGSFVFNRKRNTVELEIKQVHTGQTGVWRYLGPISIWLQELDGTFKHTLQIEDSVSRHDLTCHSKSRRNKKKKIPLCTGEEIDMDLSGMDQDSPVLWLRIDPELYLLREVLLEQPDYQWHYQLRYERDVIAQLEALDVLHNYATNPFIKTALLEIINNEHVFYRVRCEATVCLRKVANLLGSDWAAGPPAILNIFRKLFGSPSCQNIVRMNNFSNFQHYFLQKALIGAMAGLRTVHGICQPDVLRFLLDLFKYNDNSKNKFSDAYLRAALITALADTVTPVAIAPVFSSSSLSDKLSLDTKNILEEITRCFNMDKLLPSYKHVVTVSCLRAIRHLQKMGHLPSNPQIFRCHTSNNCFIEVRKVAIEILVDIVKAEVRKEDLDFLLDLVVNDPQPAIKFYTLKYLIRKPPFNIGESNPLDTEDLVERLWNLMNSHFSTNSKLRCAVIDLYYVLYGRGMPRCLRNPELSVVLNLNKSVLDEQMENNELIPSTTELLEPQNTVNQLDSSLDLSSSQKAESSILKLKIKTETLSIHEVPNSKNPNLAAFAAEVAAAQSEAKAEARAARHSPSISPNPDFALGSQSDGTNNERISPLSLTAEPSRDQVPSGVIPTICIKKSADGSGLDQYTSTSKMGGSPSKKRKEKNKEGNEAGGDTHKEKHQHHKEKKDKKKKKKKKHKSKHKHHDMDAPPIEPMEQS